MAHTAANTLDRAKQEPNDQRYPMQSASTGLNPEHETVTPARDSDLVAAIAAFGRRLHDAGMPVTPSRSAQCVRSLALTRPTSRRQLYWTTRAVFVTDSQQLETFDHVFRAVFGRVDPSASAQP